MREHRKGVAVRVASVECGAHALTVIRGLGPRGGTSPLLSNRETRPGALEDENRERPALSFFPSPSLSLCLSVVVVVVVVAVVVTAVLFFFIFFFDHDQSARQTCACACARNNSFSPSGVVRPEVRHPRYHDPPSFPRATATTERDRDDEDDDPHRSARRRDSAST